MKPNVETIRNPNSRISEAYKTLRTNIQYSSFRNEKKSIVITSAGPSEGKTTTTANLAVTIAQIGKKTMVLDCDMRSPRLHRLFGVSNGSGLSDLLVGQALYQDVVHSTDIENLYILSAGTKPPNPSELLTSEKMKVLIEILKENFDYILIDTPPVLMVTDALILSEQADGCILVVASRETEIENACRAKEMLVKVNARILGVVLNKGEERGKEYKDQYYKYYEIGINKRKRRRSRKSRGKH